MNLPCQWCGTPNVAREYIDAFTKERVREVDDHDCFAYAPNPPLDPTPTDTSFIRAAWNTQDGLERYRQWLERQR